MFLNKRAVSPLIATVLLVMIVVSIGAAVMVVIQGISEENIQSVEAQQQLIACGTDVSIGLISVGDSYRICVDPVPQGGGTGDPGNLTIYLENKGFKDVSSWRFTVIGDSGVYDSNSQGSALTTGEIKPMRFLFNGTGGGLSNIAKIRLAPKIPGGASNPLVTCIEPNLEWDTEDIAAFDLCNETNWDNSV